MLGFGKPKIAIGYDISFSLYSCYVQKLGPSDEDDAWLVVIYLLYVIRFFYICDKRQIEPFKELLRTGLHTEFDWETINFSHFHEFFFEAILKSLNEKERIASIDILGGDIPKSVKEGVGNNFKYSMYIENKPIMEYKLKLCIGPDKVLPPMILSYFLEYVYTKLVDKDSFNNLRSNVINILDYYEENDCRSIKVMSYLSNFYLNNRN